MKTYYCYTDEDGDTNAEIIKPENFDTLDNHREVDANSGIIAMMIFDTQLKIHTDRMEN